LSAMAAVETERRLLRPLLDVTRAEIERHAHERGLRWVEDESNADIVYDRNYCRHEILPLMSRRFPAARTTLARSARHQAQAARLLDALRAILTASIALRGTTFRDFQDAYGGRGGYARELKVYGRGGEPCARCGAELQETHKLEGRSTVWCRSCQK